jgi:hypothetical protein
MINARNNEQINGTQTFQARVQLQYIRMPVEIICGGSIKSMEPLHMPIQSEHPISATKQAFLDMAKGPILDLDDCEDYANTYEEDPEILLSDSDEEDEDDLIEDCEDAEVDTAIGSDDDECSDIPDEESLGMDCFDEATDYHTFEQLRESQNPA